MHLPRIGLLVGTLLASNLTMAQTAITHNGLDADFYEADDNTVVLLLHGTLAHNRMEIITTISELVADDYGIPVLAPSLSYDLPGREGMLDCGITHTHKHFDALTEIETWVSYLEDQGFDNIIVSAHSRGGGQMSAYLAAEPSEKIQGAVLIAPAVFDAEKAATGYQERYGVALSGLMEQAKQMDENAIMDVPGFVYCQQAKVSAATFIDYYTPDSRRDTPTNLTQVKNIPVVVVAGSEDDVVKDLPEKLESTQGIGENVSLEMIDGADHFFRDLYADDVAVVIADMVESL